MDPKDWTLLFQGAESKVRLGKYNGEEAIWKERFPKKYRHPDLDKRLAKERTRSEVRNMTKIKERCPEISFTIPKILFTDDRNIIMTYVTNSETSCRFIEGAIKKETNIDWLFSAIGRIVGLIHKVGVIHGDLTTSNFLINQNNQVIPIDFGLSSHSTSPEDRAVDLYVLERALQTTHIKEEKFQLILEEYRKTMHSPENEKVIKKLDDVRARGRKRLMIG